MGFALNCNMNISSKYLLSAVFTLTAAFGVGCDKPSPEAETTAPHEEPETKAAEDEELANLCSDYASCNDCITGQVAAGHNEGAAETQCALAVTGCWTTWNKPVVCGETTYDEQPT
jgi:hypothetical protein